MAGWSAAGRRSKKNKNLMEAIAMVGPDCRVAWQSEGSAKIQRVPIGTPMIAHKLVLPTEEVRDAIFAGKSIGFRDQPIAHEWDRNLLITRDYRPIFDQDGKIIGIIAVGFSRTPAGPIEIDELRAIVAALEFQAPQSPVCAESLGLGSCPVELSGLQRAALRLRKFLPQPVG
jgi:hypothetical protein